MLSRNLKALISYIFEVIWILVNLLVMVLWIQCLDVEEPGDGTCHFDQSYVDEGFCNASYTQLACGTFDLSMSILSLIVIHAHFRGRNSMVGVLGAGYTIIHGLAHLAIGFKIIPTDVPVDALGYVVLAIILGIGAAALGKLIEETTNSPNKAILWAVAAEVLMVYIFWKFIKDGIWVLTYVNIAINLCIFIPRIILVPATNVSRVDAYEPYFLASLASVSMMMCVIFVEPVFCSWLLKFGGHFVFDISLFLVILIAAISFGVQAAHPLLVYLGRHRRAD